MRRGLEKIRSGQFAQEWAAEQVVGCPTLAALKEAARSLPLYELERELRRALGGDIPTYRPTSTVRPAPKEETPPPAAPAARRWAWLRLLWPWRSRPPDTAPLEVTQTKPVLRRFLSRAAEDSALREFSRGRQLTTHCVSKDVGLEFTVRFDDGLVVTELRPPDGPAEVRLETTVEVNVRFDRNNSRNAGEPTQVLQTVLRCPSGSLSRSDLSP